MENAIYTAEAAAVIEYKCGCSHEFDGLGKSLGVRECRQCRENSEKLRAMEGLRDAYAEAIEDMETLLGMWRNEATA